MMPQVCFISEPVSRSLGPQKDARSKPCKAPQEHMKRFSKHRRGGVPPGGNGHKFKASGLQLKVWPSARKQLR